MRAPDRGYLVINLVGRRVTVVSLEIDKKWSSLIHQDATALLRPKTGLKDMFIEVDPGSDKPTRVKILVKDGTRLRAGKSGTVIEAEKK